MLVPLQECIASRMSHLRRFVCSSWSGGTGETRFLCREGYEGVVDLQSKERLTPVESGTLWSNLVEVAKWSGRGRRWPEKAGESGRGWTGRKRDPTGVRLEKPADHMQIVLFDRFQSKDRMEQLVA